MLIVFVILCEFVIVIILGGSGVVGVWVVTGAFIVEVFVFVVIVIIVW